MKNLIKALSQKVAPHFLFVIQQVHKRLISLSNIDEPAAEDVQQPTTTPAIVPSNKETEIAT
jgi:hypothetical protein